MFTQIVSCGVPDVLVLDEDGRVNLLTSDGIEVAVSLEVPEDFSPFVGEAGLQDDWLLHQLVSYAAQQVVWNLKLTSVLLLLFCSKMTSHLLVDVLTNLTAQLSLWLSQSLACRGLIRSGYVLSDQIGLLGRTVGRCRLGGTLLIKRLVHIN